MRDYPLRAVVGVVFEMLDFAFGPLHRYRFSGFPAHFHRRMRQMRSRKRARSQSSPCVRHEPSRARAVSASISTPHSEAIAAGDVNFDDALNRVATRGPGLCDCGFHCRHLYASL